MRKKMKKKSVNQSIVIRSVVVGIALIKLVISLKLVIINIPHASNASAPTTIPRLWLFRRRRQRRLRFLLFFCDLDVLLLHRFLIALRRHMFWDGVETKVLKPADLVVDDCFRFGYIWSQSHGGGNMGSGILCLCSNLIGYW